MNTLIDKKGIVIGLVVIGLLGVSAAATDDSTIICVAEMDVAWVATDGGQSFASIPSLAGESLSAVLVSEGVIYVGGQSGLHVSTDLGATFTLRGSDCGVPPGGVSAIAQHGGCLYIGTGNSYVGVSEDGGETFRKLARAASWVSSILPLEDVLYVGTGGGLCVSSDGGESFVTRTTENGLAYNLVYSIAADDMGLYVGTLHGLSISTDGGETFINRTTEDGLPSNRVEAVCVNEGVMYIGTQTGLTISYDGGTTFEAKGRDGGLSTGMVRSIAVCDGAVYVYVGGDVFVSFDACETFQELSTDAFNAATARSMSVE